jgi:hypothetical protein
LRQCEGSAKLATMQPQTKPQREAETRTVPTEKTPLDKAIDEIRSDAARDPEAYARETVVPDGGE